MTEEKNIKQQLLDKMQDVDNIKEKLSRAKAFYIAKYDGISVEKMTKLRKTLRTSDSELSVYKNTLIKIAIKDEPYAEKFTNMLKGPNTITFAYGDPTATAKALFEFAGANKLEIKGCLFENQFFGPDKIEVIKDLPSRDVLLSMIANVLNEPMSRVARILDALKEKKENAN